MKYLKIMILIFSCLAVSVRPASARALEKYDLNTIPVPESFHEVSSKTDITEHSIYPLIKEFENSILSHIDPLSFEREFGEMQGDSLPGYDFMQFNTEMHPKDIFGFYKVFYENLTGGKSYSEMHYDASAGDSPSLCKNNEIVYYVIKISTNIGSKDLYYSISAFRNIYDKQTEVYIFTYEK